MNTPDDLREPMGPAAKRHKVSCHEIAESMATKAGAGQIVRHRVLQQIGECSDRGCHKPKLYMYPVVLCSCCERVKKDALKSLREKVLEVPSFAIAPHRSRPPESHCAASSCPDGKPVEQKVAPSHCESESDRPSFSEELARILAEQDYIDIVAADSHLDGTSRP